MKKFNAEDLVAGVWSAAPTPLTTRMEVDIDATRRMVKHHLRLGVDGLFLCGTNGEGPWLREDQRRTLVRTVVRSVGRRMPVAVQVTDNSAARILDNMGKAREDGADIAVIAPPFCLFNATPANVLQLYRTAIRQSPLPVGIYDRGVNSAVVVPDSILSAIYAEKNVVMIKDSSVSETRLRIALAARKRRPRLKLLTGAEFECVRYLRAGYDGLLLGGGVFNGAMARAILEASQEANWRRAEWLQRRMNRMMWAIYGGRKIRCWLSGEKYLLMRLGIFRTWKNYLNYPLTPVCRRAILRVLRREGEYLLPW